MNIFEEKEKTLVQRNIDRIMSRLEKGRAINPCAYNQKELARIIIQQLNHVSFKNFPALMNDEEFVLELAQTSLNPLDCENYFYDYVNENLKRNARFKYNYVIALFVNDEIYKLDDLLKIVEALDLLKYFHKALEDKNAKQIIVDRLTQAQANPCAAKFNGVDDSKLLKLRRNQEVMRNKSKIIGLEKIAKMFTCLTDDEQAKIDEEERFMEEIRQPQPGVCY